MTEPTHLDDFIRFGRHTVLLCVIIEIMMLVQCGSFLFMIFGGAAPKFVGCLNSTLTNSTNFSEKELCTLYHQGLCDPQLEYEFLSVNVEFLRICDDAKDVKNTMTYQMVGFAVGAIIFGQISDLFGRKWTIFVCAVIQAFFGFAMYFSWNLEMFSILNVFVTLFSTGHDVVANVFMSESFPKEHRFWMFFVFSWAPNTALAALLAYFAGNWRTLINMFNVLCLIGCGLLLLVDDTAHFLVRKGRVDGAINAIRRIHKFNGHSLDENALKKVVMVEQSQAEKKANTKNYFYHHLFCTWKLIGFTFAVCLSNFCASIITFGVVFNMEKIPGSIYFNTALTGIIRYASNLCVALADNKFDWMGRKFVHNIFSSYTIVAVSLAVVIQFLASTPLLNIINQFLLISAISVVGQIYSIIGLSTTEIFPTPIRNAAFGITQLSEACACALAPQMFQWTFISVHFPFILMVVLQICEFTSYNCLIPETKGHPLPDKMPPMEQRFAPFRRRQAVVDDSISVGSI